RDGLSDQMSRLKEQAIKAEDSARPAIRLGELASQGFGVFCWCNRCFHSQVLSLDVLIPRLGPDMAVPDIGARMRCSKCGSRDIATRPDWPSNGPSDGSGVRRSRASGSVAAQRSLPSQD
ncbi:MAG: hypothetical protein AAFW76_07460, partial [Pseudomonadota bacterium]